jgi:hypothetical protein
MSKESVIEMNRTRELTQQGRSMDEWVETVKRDQLPTLKSAMLVADIGYTNLVNQVALQNSDVVLSGIFSRYFSREHYVLLDCILTDQEDLSNSV